MLNVLLERFNIDYLVNDRVFKSIRKRAYERCSKKTTEDFIKEVNAISPNIEILGKYEAARKTISCRCKVCGHKRNPTADNLLQGQGCPACGKRRTAEASAYSLEQFLDAHKDELNPNIKIIGTFVNTSTYIKCKCLTCGYEWNPLPSDLAHGSGCPRCAGVMKKTHEQFCNEMKEINPNVKILGRYETHNTPLLCECLICGKQWMPRPKHLLTNHGCPFCAGTNRLSMDDIISRIGEKSIDVEPIGEYSNADTPMRFKCTRCGYEWEQIPRILLKSRGCKKCFPYTEKQDKKWADMYEVAKQYYLKHGDLNIAARASYAGRPLGKWVHLQRRIYRNSLLPEEERNNSLGGISRGRIDCLNSIGMKW